MARRAALQGHPRALPRGALHTPLDPRRAATPPHSPPPLPPHPNPPPNTTTPSRPTAPPRPTASPPLLQVLDARDPQGTRCRFLESHLRKNSRHKHLLLLLNKCDLASGGVEGLAGMVGTWAGGRGPACTQTRGR